MDECRVHLGSESNPQRDRAWYDLVAVVESGKPVKRPEQRRLIGQADRYLRAHFDLWLAATAWYDVVVSNLDDSIEREHLLKTIRRFL